MPCLSDQDSGLAPIQIHIGMTDTEHRPIATRTPEIGLQFQGSLGRTNLRSLYIDSQTGVKQVKTTVRTSVQVLAIRIQRHVLRI